jgi:hypothetical protein
LAAFRCDFLDLLFRPVGEVSWVRVVCRCHDAGSFGLRKLKSLEVFRYLEKILCVPVVDGCIGNGRVSPTFIFGLLGGRCNVDDVNTIIRITLSLECQA